MKSDLILVQRALLSPGDGSGARPMHPDWLRSLRDQCVATRTALFVKQWGEWGPAQWQVGGEPGESIKDYRARAKAAGATHAARTLRGGLALVEATAPAWSPGREPLPAGPAGIRRWGRHQTGHELDGQEWRQFPRPLVAA